MNGENIPMRTDISPDVLKTINKQKNKGRIAVRLNDNAKTIIFVKSGADIEAAKESFRNRLDSYNSLSAKAAEARSKTDDDSVV